jgi:hypothetical protein
MTMFDSSGYDIPTLIEKLRDQRFDGYDDGLLAGEVEKFRNGPGTASMGNAVSALKSVVSTLANTDGTLRTQLDGLGVTWQSQGGGQASAVLAEQAGFADQAYQNVNQAAQLIFEQGEAFNRTKNKLPDPQTLRQGEGGYSFTDTVFSLFGFETDHASAVKAGDEARAQAVDALNAYAHDSGNYLASSQVVAQPQALNTAPPPPPPAGGPGAGAPEQTAPVPDLGPTVAASAKDAFPAPHRAPAPPPPPVYDSTPPPAGGLAAPLPVPTQQTAPQSTSPSSADFAEPGGGSTSVIGGSGGGFDDTDSLRPGRSTTSTGPGQGLGTTPPIDANQAGLGALGGTSGDGTAGSPGRPGPGGGGLPGGGATGGGAGATGGTGAPDGLAGRDSVLGKGKMVGMGPISPSANSPVGPGFGPTRGPSGIGGADGVTAIGAGAVGAATSGETDSRGRGIGRSTAADRGKAIRPLDVGDLPEEEEARRANQAGAQVPSRERTRAILEPAATQDGEEDAEHVRRYGVDDRDLFSDQREVSPDLIGDRPMPEDR